MLKKKIVVIGGGNGSAISIVALKQHLDLFDISAVISMSDSGGSSGKLRKEFNTVPPGDIMRAVLALSKYDYLTLKQIFYRNRFSEGKLEGHNLGNLFLVLGAEKCGDFMQAVKALEESVEAVGHAYPATLDVTDLCAELDNGQIVKTEAAIDKPNYDLSIKIKKVWLEPKGEIYFGAKQAIEAADYVVFSPGSLYTSVIATILPAGMKETIGRSKAKLIFAMGDAYIRNSETGPTTVSGVIKTLEQYLPRSLDLTVFNNAKFNHKQQEMHDKRGWAHFTDDIENQKGMNITKLDYERDEGGLCSIKLGKIFKNILF